MAIRKNKKRIDPRHFLHETTYRDAHEIIQELGGVGHSSITPEDAAKAKEIAPVLEQSPEIMAAVKEAAQDPKVQAAVKQAIEQAGLMQEEGDALGAAYQKRADRLETGSKVASGTAAATLIGSLGASALGAIGTTAVSTKALMAIGVVGGPVLAAIAGLIAVALIMDSEKARRKANVPSLQSAEDFSPEEWMGIQSGESVK